MKTINIADTVFEYLEAVETEQFYNGASRRTLTVTCAADVLSLNDVNNLLTEPNLAIIGLADSETGAVTFHEGYILKLECGIKSVLVQKETPETPAVYAERLVFKLGKRTYIEEQLFRLGL